MKRPSFYLICYDLCCSLLSELRPGTSEDGWFIGLCINGQGHMERKSAEETAMTLSLFALLPRTLKCFFHCRGNRGVKHLHW